MDPFVLEALLGWVGRQDLLTELVASVAGWKLKPAGGYELF